jgi:hypothetical protein
MHKPCHRNPLLAQWRQQPLGHRGHVANTREGSVSAIASARQIVDRDGHFTAGAGRR